MKVISIFGQMHSFQKPVSCFGIKWKHWYALSDPHLQIFISIFFATQSKTVTLGSRDSSKLLYHKSEVIFTLFDSILPPFVV